MAKVLKIGDRVMTIGVCCGCGKPAPNDQHIWCATCLPLVQALFKWARGVIK